MIYKYTQRSLKMAVHTMLQFSLLLTCLLSASVLRAESVYAKVIEVTLTVTPALQVEQQVK